ncbi:MAG TPA: amidohydrolase family protein [bacterium]|nr:amidohydrolase family protein [bacterium]
MNCFRSFSKGSMVVVLHLVLLTLGQPVFADEPPIPLIDAHNQYDGTFQHEDILRFMDRYGIGRMILAPAARADDRALVQFGAQHTDRLTIAVRTKDRRLIRNGDAGGIVDEVQRGGYGAFEELLLWHADKGGTKGVAESQVSGGEITLDIAGATVRELVDVARRRNWPMIPHIEFASAGAKGPELMKQFEALLASNRDVSFGLIHRGQLDEGEARRLIGIHPNVFFLLSQSTDPRKARIGFTSIVSSQALDSDWLALIRAHPDRFVLSFDAFSGRLWTEQMARETGIWRTILTKLPLEVAHAVGHGNAERLWRLPPTPPLAANNSSLPLGPRAPAANTPTEGRQKGRGR